MNFDFSFFLHLFPSIIKYGGTTIRLSALAIFCGLCLAFLIAIVMDLRIPGLSQFFRLYISFFRSTPLMAQLFCFYFGILPAIRGAVKSVSSFQAALIILSLASAAYMAESLRAAIGSVPKGQFEAAQSIGMTYPQAMRRIILPQAVRVALPTLFSSFINIVKDTSLVFAIGVKEMMAQAQLEGSGNYRYLEAYLCVLLVFWAITAVMGRTQRALEGRLAGSMGAKK